MTDGNAPDHDTVQIVLQGGHRFDITLAVDGAERHALEQWRRGDARDTVLQLPLDEGRGALTVCGADIASVALPVAEHPAMNTAEGHLGGYISARHPEAEKLGTLHGDPATFFPKLWQWTVAELGVHSVLDVGCGEGHAAAYLAGLGCTVRGVDGSQLALRDSVIPEHHVLHDFTSGPYDPGQDYDLVWCCEFVEHVQDAFVDNFLASFRRAARYLFITAASPGQVGWHHVNCRPRDYWIGRIEPLGLVFDAELTASAAALAGPGHFARNGMVFRRR